MGLIILLRHGDAEPDSGEGDFSRALTEKGRLQAIAAGRTVAALDLKPEACLTSPKTRAAQTAELACASLDITPIYEDALALPDHQVEVLASGWSSVLLVGHEPMMSAEIARLSGATVKFRKGGLALLDGHRLKMLAGPDLTSLASG